MPSRISLYPDLSKATTKSSYHFIFFITGNPGLISYYTTFLSTLHTLLQKNEDNLFHTYGQSLAGFEDDDPIPSQPLNKPPLHPFSLEQQIQFLLQCLQSQRIPNGPRQGQPHDSITLIGHSVGSYILLELLSRLRKVSSPLNVGAGILLFPTVTHIAQSPSGLKISTLFRIPDFPRRAALVAKALIGSVPKGFLKWLVGKVTGMPSDARDVTVEFLWSRMGIWQALHMAKDEMETITEDRWDEDIWGAEHEDLDLEVSPPRLFFFFGQKDHWVAKHTRDALITVRGNNGLGDQASKPVMLIDENGIDHGFCIRHSEMVAEKVAVWIEGVLKPLETGGPD